MDPLSKGKIYHFKCDNEGEYVETQSYTGPDKRCHHHFLILSHKKYNEYSSHALGICITSSKIQRFTYKLDPDDFENASQVPRDLLYNSKVLLDKPCRLDGKHFNKDGSRHLLNSKERIKLSRAAYCKIVNKIKEFIS